MKEREMDGSALSLRRPAQLERSQILPEPELPDAAGLLAEGRRLARTVTVGGCPFLTEYGVRSESEYKRRRMAEGEIMFHAQFGYRGQDKSRRAYAEIYERLAAAGYHLDRYGICLDWSMGYPAALRANMPRGTGLILAEPDDFATLTREAPVAPHFGDFVIGTPAAVENAAAALAAGSTSVGNLGQYFTFRLPRWDDDVDTTAETVKALALCAAQPVEVLIHSNLDDGFAALFTDLACGIGAVLVERYIVENLVGGHVSHCYGHVFSEPLTRLAFQRALARVTDTPGSMVYGNTTIYVASEVENYANLASYLLVDLVAQRLRPTGHGLNPVPVTEALRIPEIDEIVDAHLFANRLAQRAGGFELLFDLEAADRVADHLVAGGQRFKDNVLSGLAEAGIDVGNPFEMLLSIRRIGARRLEELFGPGEPREGVLRKRLPLVRATTVAALEAQGDGVVAALNPADREAIRRARLTACVTCTDVHEYGKILVEAALEQLGVEVVDAGVSADPDTVAARASACAADFVAVSTYNGVALAYLQALGQEMARLELEIPILIGGKLNQIPADSPSSMPVDVSADLRALGAVVCHRVEEMLVAVAKMARSEGHG
jgi:methylmalonyl-CoA mutase cobalamin-binding subunit